MPYSPTAWVDNSIPDLSAANLNNIEDGVSKAAYAPDASASFVPVGDGLGAWVYKKLTHSELDAAAGIVEGQLGLTDVTTADATTGRHGFLPKLAGSSSVFLDGTGAFSAPSSSAPLDFAQVTTNQAISATSEAASAAIITGNSISYPNSRLKIEFWGIANATAALQATFVFFRDSTVLGKFQIGMPTSSAGGRIPVALACFDTPTAAAHTYAIKAWVSTSILTVIAGVGGSGTDLPASLIVTKAA